MFKIKFKPLILFFHYLRKINFFDLFLDSNFKSLLHQFDSLLLFFFQFCRLFFGFALCCLNFISHNLHLFFNLILKVLGHPFLHLHLLQILFHSSRNFTLRIYFSLQICNLLFSHFLLFLSRIVLSFFEFVKFRAQVNFFLFCHFKLFNCKS